jgi:hypothetical protein
MRAGPTRVTQSTTSKRGYRGAGSRNRGSTRDRLQPLGPGQADQSQDLTLPRHFGVRRKQPTTAHLDRSRAHKSCRKPETRYSGGSTPEEVDPSPCFSPTRRVQRLVSTQADNESGHCVQSETEFDNLWNRPGSRPHSGASRRRSVRPSCFSLPHYCSGRPVAARQRAAWA